MYVLVKSETETDLTSKQSWRDSNPSHCDALGTESDSVTEKEESLISADQARHSYPRN